MLKIIFSEKADADLHNFITNYEEPFLELYNDTGIWSEHEIIENYQKSARSLYQGIRTAIINKLCTEKVLGRKEIGRVMELSFHVGNRLIVVFFSDNKEADERWIESIFIDRKPIIF